MREKLLDLMKSEGLKPSQLAELLEINPAGVSHILAGRNKPGFDLLQKILRRFPRINPDWLLLDSEQMYRNGNTPGSSVPSVPSGVRPTVADNLFASPDSTTPEPKNPIPEISRPAQVDTTALTHRTDAAVQRVVIFYDDQTFESYMPTKR